MPADRAAVPERAPFTRLLALAFTVVVRGGGWWMLGAVALSLAGGVGPVAAVWLTKALIDGLAGADGPSPSTLAWALAGCAAGLALTQYAGRVFESESARRIHRRVSDDLFRAVARQRGLSMVERPEYHDRLRLAQSVADLGPGELLGSLLGLITAAVTAGGYIILLTRFSLGLGLAIVVASVPGLMAQLILARRRATVMWQVTPLERRREFFAALLTDVRAAKETRLFGLAGYLRDRMLGQLDSAHREERRMDWAVLRVDSLIAALGTLVSGLTTVYAVREVLAGRLTVGGLVVVISALTMLQATLASAFGQVAMLHRICVRLDHLHHVVRLPDDLTSTTHPARPLPRLRHAIELRDVWFRYRPDLPWVLRGVNLRLAAGSCTALVGVNGAGKSTVVKLLCRLYDPVHGAVTWDGVDLRELDPDELRQQVTIVFQDFMTYDLTVAENIAVGDLTALGDADRLAAAARLAGVHDTLMSLPDGYATMLSRVHTDRGARDAGLLPSGGQWQRLAIARAALRADVDLAILDEPSAGLDPASEYDVHQRLREQRRGRTSLLISHRLGAVRDADRIVVLDEGRTVESGTHPELIAACGAYERLFHLQAAPYQPDPAAAVAHP